MSLQRNKITKVLKALTLVVTSFLLFVVHADSAEAETYSASFTTTGDISIDVSPKLEEGAATAVGSDTITATSTCPFGYTLQIASSSNNASLYLDGNTENAEDDDTVINAVTGTGSLQNNNWGYSLTSNTPAGLFTGITSEASTLPSGGAWGSDISPAGGDVIPIYYGVKISGAAAAGSYKMANDGRIVYSMVSDALCYSYTIKYDKNADNATGEMSNQELQYGELVTLSANNYARIGHKFLGWSTDEDAVTPDYADNATIEDLSEIISNGEVTLYAVWEDEYWFVYEKNGVQVTGEMSYYDHHTVAEQNKSAVLETPYYQRSGYGFKGWSTDSSGNGTMYGPNETVEITQGILSLADENNLIKLYAIWQPAETEDDEPVYLQGWMSCHNLGIGDTTALTDSRDGNVYTITKLADGRCWMTENLRLDLGNVSINANNTNNPKTTDYANANSNDIVYSGNNDGYGFYYNWRTATAGNGSSVGSGIVLGDICPSGWHLPRGNGLGDFADLSFALGGLRESMHELSNPTGADISKELRSYPNNFVYGGYKSSSSPNRIGEEGHYWSSYGVGGEDSYHLSFSAVNVNPGILAARKTSEKSVRCVTGATYEVEFNSNAGQANVSGTMSPQFIESGMTTPLNPNKFERPDLMDDNENQGKKIWYDFNAWNTLANGQGTSYQDKAEVLDLALAGGSVELKAQWEPKNVVDVVFHGNGLKFSGSDDNHVYYYKSGVGNKASYTVKGGEYKEPDTKNLNKAFWGWSKTQSASSAQVGKAADDVEAALTKENGETEEFYAVWKNLLTIKFDKNGGNGEMENQKVGKEYRASLAPNKFSKDGYSFVGWNTEQDGSGDSYVDKEYYYLPENVEPNAEITLYAQWERVYTIEFNNNGGLGSATQTFIYGETKKLNYGSGFGKKGFTLVSWNTKADGSGDKITPLDKEITMNDSFIAYDRNDYGVEDYTIVLYAQWGTTYTLRYVAEGSSTSLETQIQKTTNSSYEFTVTSTIPTRTGYTFLGWATTADAEVAEYHAGDSIEISAPTTSKTLYAVWESNVYTYTLYYNANNGIDAPATQTSQETTNTSYTFEVSQNVPTRTGYTFLGWALTNDATEAAYSGGSNIEISAPTTSKTLYAVWESNVYTYTYTLSYSANNGIDAPATQTSQETTETSYTFEVSQNVPTRTGYTFLGWALTDDATEVAYHAGDNITINANDGTTVTLYAVWKEEETSTIITFEVDSDIAEFSNSNSSSNEVHYYNNNGSVTVIEGTYIEPTATKGQRFLSWNTNSDGTGTNYTTKQAIEGAITSERREFTLYAIWQKRLKIMFMGNGGSGDMQEQFCPEGESVNLASNLFTRSGYRFGGWNTESDGKGDEYANGATYIASSFNYGDSKALFAQWVPQFTLQYDGNGATSGSVGSVTADVNRGITIEANGFTKTGFHFIEWNTKADGSGTSINAGSSYTAPAETEAGTTITLYAIWGEENQHVTITFRTDNEDQGEDNVYFTNSDGSRSDTNEVHYYRENGSLTNSLGAYVAPTTAWNREFVAWNTLANGNGTSYETEDEIKNAISGNSGNITLYAETVAKYRINYDGNGADRGSVSPQYIKENESTALNGRGSLYKANNVFIGWNTSADGTGTTVPASVKITESNDVVYLEWTENENTVNVAINVNNNIITLYAQWSENYHIVFDKNDNSATGSMDPIDIHIGQKIDNQDLSTEFERSGADFLYWNTEADGSGYSIPNNATITASVEKGITWSWAGNGGTTSVDTSLDNNNAVTLYAQWGTIFTLEYDANGGSGAPDTQIVYSDAIGDTSYTFEVSQNVPTLTGYTFLGWALTNDATEAAYSGGSNIEISAPTTTVTLYAVWGRTYTYTLSYNTNGGSGDAPATQTSQETTETSYEFLVSHNVSTRTGYRFKGWATTANATKAAYYAGDDITINANDGTTVTLYAVWELITYTYTLQYDANGGSLGDITNSATATETSNSGHTFTIVSITPSRENCTFLGWSTSRGSGATYAPGDNIDVDAGETITLYAVWKISGATVTFNANNGEYVSGSSKTVTYDNFQFDTSEGIFKTVVMDMDGFGVVSMTSNVAKYIFENKYQLKDFLLGVTSGTIDMTNIVQSLDTYNDNMTAIDQVTFIGGGDDTTVLLMYSLPENGGDQLGILQGNYSTVSEIYANYDKGLLEGTSDSELHTEIINTTGNVTIGMMTNGTTSGLGYIAVVLSETDGESAYGGHVSGDSRVDFIASTTSGAYEEPTRNGYKFLGWSTDSNATVATLFNEQDVINYLYNENVTAGTLYAVWELSAANIAFDANNGQFESGSTNNTLGYRIENSEGIYKTSIASDSFPVLVSMTNNLWRYMNDNQIAIEDVVFGMTGGDGAYAEYMLSRYALGNIQDCSDNMLETDVMSFPGAVSTYAGVAYWLPDADDRIGVLKGSFLTPQAVYGASIENILTMSQTSLPNSWVNEDGLIQTDAITVGISTDNAEGGLGYFMFAFAFDENGNFAPGYHIPNVTTTSGTYENPTRTGYTFLGWSTNSNSVEAEFANEEEVTNYLYRTNTSAATLYAVWGEEE